MARQLTFTTTLGPPALRATNSFVPNTTFILFVDTNADLQGTGGTPTEAYQIEFQPTNIEEDDTWLPAPGTNNGVLQLSTKYSTVTGSPGFRYRVRQTTGTTQSTDIGFYWDHVTSLRSVFN